MTVEKITRCWSCGYRHDRATSAFGPAGLEPEDGDISICIRCGVFAVYDGKAANGLRKPTESEGLDIVGDEDAQRAAMAWREMDALRRSAN